MATRQDTGSSGSSEPRRTPTVDGIPMSQPNSLGPSHALPKMRQSPTPQETDGLMTSPRTPNTPFTGYSPMVVQSGSGDDLVSRARHNTSTGPTPTTTPVHPPVVSSPLNPNLFSPMISPRAGSSPASGLGIGLRPPTTPGQVRRIPSEDAIALTAPTRSPSNGTLQSSGRGSMLLYRLAGSDETGELLPPAAFSRKKRDSFASSSGDSTFSLSSDSKYPSGFASRGGMVPYAFDPFMTDAENEEADALHEGPEAKPSHAMGSRGFINILVLLCLVLGLLTLFMVYPIITHFANNARRLAIDGNIRVNSTGQTPVLFQMPDLVDTDTPQSALTRTGFDGKQYDLVFSDEFNTEGRTFYPGDDPYWTAVDLWYGVTGDLEWYDPGQVTTRDGKLVIRIDEGPGPGAGFGGSHNLTYRSGMLQSWNQFCFTGGYIEVAVTFPGPDSNTLGYWPGAWTMGNLGRPGYPATTDGLWPYTYNSCDVGTFPNQTRKDKLGPEAALHTTLGREKYNYELSWLPGQRVSACTCPGGDHPGPNIATGRGAPEIDIFEAQRNKRTKIGGTVSQSAQFAPFTRDYGFFNNTGNYDIEDTTLTYPNDYRGSAIQQAVSSLTVVPDDMFQGSGEVFTVFGFEYDSNPATPEEGYIQWVVNDKPSVRMEAGAVPADPEAAGGTGVGQRLIPVEPMSMILNCGISRNWQTVDPSTMIFPSEMLVDYVRIYQHSGAPNIGCSPPGFPTSDYIERHLDVYTNANITKWPYPKPKNSLYDGCD